MKNIVEIGKQLLNEYESKGTIPDCSIIDSVHEGWILRSYFEKHIDVWEMISLEIEKKTLKDSFVDFKEEFDKGLKDSAMRSWMNILSMLCRSCIESYNSSSGVDLGVAQRLRSNVLEIWINQFKDFPEFKIHLRKTYQDFLMFGGSEEIVEKLK